MGGGGAGDGGGRQGQLCLGSKAGEGRRAASLLRPEQGKILSQKELGGELCLMGSWAPAVDPQVSG